MRSFVNKPGGAITRSLEGMALCHPEMIEIHYDPDFVRRVVPAAPGKVAVISGSGSGHEPLPVGFVGQGMLDAACPGPLFTSPTPDQLIAATHAVESGGGVVFIVKNYSGGVLNAELTLESMQMEELKAESVLVADDVSISQEQNRRGLGAAMLAMKIAGAAAEAGYNLQEVVKVTSRAVVHARSMGVATNANTLPQSVHGDSLNEDTVEVGVGIHGEPGRRHTVKNGVEEIVERLLGPILADLPFERGNRVLVLVSGMGGTPPLELYLLFQEIHRRLKVEDLTVKRQLVGNYMTSLGRGGYIVTVARLDDELIKLWDAPVCTPALRW